MAAAGGGAMLAVGGGSVVVVGMHGRCDKWVGSGESRGTDNRVELSLSCGVRGEVVGLGGGRPRFWLWSGLLFLMEKQSRDDGVCLNRLAVVMSGSGLN